MGKDKPVSTRIEQADLTAGKPEQGTDQNVAHKRKTNAKPKRGVRENVAHTRQPAKAALGAAPSSASSDDNDKAYAALTDALGTTNPDFVQGLFGHLLNASARGPNKYETRELFFMLSVIQEKKAKDPLLAMQLAQMGAVPPP